MNFPLLIGARGSIAVVLAFALGACGSNEDSSTVASKPQQQQPQQQQQQPEPAARPLEPQRSSMTKAEIAALPEYKIAAAEGPVPEQLEIHDLRKGFGPAVTSSPRDILLMRFASAYYGEAVRMPATRDRKVRFRMNEMVDAWKEGLPGMRVGGRRELIAPDATASKNGTLIYQIDLLALQRN